MLQQRNEAIDAVTANTQGDYATLAYNMMRQQRISGAWWLYFTLDGQVASKNLDSSEKIALGGSSGVRGYPQGDTTGDAGYIASAELHYDYATRLGILQPFVFVDKGSVKINERPFIVGAANHKQLTSRGLGIGLGKPNDFLFKVTVAMRGGAPARADKDEHVRTWLQATKYF